MGYALPVLHQDHFRSVDGRNLRLGEGLARSAERAVHRRSGAALDGRGILAADPKPPPEVGVAEIADAAYTTPYLELMQQAIAELGISAANQPKKDDVLEWFRGRKVGGIPLSENHICYLASFVRLPHSQKGGNRKWSAASAERPQPFFWVLPFRGQG
jgi:hypothetical protein